MLVILLVRVEEERLRIGGAADTVCLEHVAFRYVFVGRVTPMNSCYFFFLCFLVLIFLTMSTCSVGK